MHNQQQHDSGMTKYGAHPQMAKAPTQPFFQLQMLKESLKDDQPGK